MAMMADGALWKTSNVLYFCHACGRRLRGDEVRAAWGRGESHHTAACSSCSKQGRCSRRPLEYEDRVLRSPREMAHPAPPDLQETAPLPAVPKPVLGAPVATSTGRPHAQKQGAAAQRAFKGGPGTVRARADAVVSARAPLRLVPARVLVGIGLTALLVLLGCLCLWPKSNSPRGPRAQDAGAASTVLATPTESSVSATAVSTRSSVEDRATVSRLIPASALASTGTPVRVPSGEAAGPSPKRPLDLKSAGREFDAARDAERAKSFAAFESSLPTVERLGSFEGRLAFGPEAGPGVQLTEGADSLRKPDGKAAYFDGSRTVTVQRDRFGTLESGQVILQYAAVCDVAIVLRIFGEHDVSSTIRLPAGPLQTKAIAVSNKRASKDGLKMGYRGNWEGRGYGRIRIEFKEVKPGTVALFRIGY